MSSDCEEEKNEKFILIFATVKETVMTRDSIYLKGWKVSC